MSSISLCHPLWHGKCKPSLVAGTGINSLLVVNSSVIFPPILDPMAVNWVHLVLIIIFLGALQR